MILRSVREGSLRALASPRLILWLWGANLLLALPAAWAVSVSIHESAGETLAAGHLQAGFDTAWHGEFRHHARGLETTFGPHVAGAGAVLRNVEGWLTGALFEHPATLLGLGLLWLLAWQLFQGGILDRLVHPRRERLTMGGFLGAGGRYFFRFVRLGVLSGVAYFLLYRLSRWAYDRLGDLTRDVTTETEVILLSLAVLGLGALLLVVVHMSFAYAKIATVMEDRRSMFLAILRGAGFVLSHPLAALGVYGSLALVSAALLAAYTLLAAGAGQSTVGAVILAFLGGQVFLASRLTIRVALLASQAVLYGALTPGADL